jgi:uncharacterized protein (DUF433 family)
VDGEAERRGDRGSTRRHGGLGVHGGRRLPWNDSTRVTVEHVLQELANGVAEDELLRGHPRLTHDHLRAAWAYAAAVIGLEQTLLG